MELLQRLKTEGGQKKLLIGMVACLCLYTLVGFLILPPLFKWILAKKLTEQLHRQVTIKDVDLNPYVLSLTVEGFTIKEPAGSEAFISFDELYANLQIVSAFKRAPILKELRLQGPYVHLVQESEAQYNFSDLMAKEPSEPQEPEPESGPFRFSLNNIQLLNGSIAFVDVPKDRHHQITDLNITLPFLSNLPVHMEAFTQPLFSAKINGRPVSLEGKTKPFADSVETILDIALDVDIPYYLAYLPFEWQAKVLSGLLNIEASLSYMQYGDRSPTLSVAGDVFLKTLEVVDGEERPLLKFPLIHISIAESELMSKNFHLSKILLESPEVQITRQKDGGLSIQSMIPQDEEEKEAPPPPEKGEETAASVSVKNISLEGGSIRFLDRQIEPNYSVSLVEMKGAISGLSSEETAPAEVLFKGKLNDYAPLEIEAKMNPLAKDLFLDLRVSFKDIDLSPMSPYTGKYVGQTIEKGKLFLDLQYLIEKKKLESENRLFIDQFTFGNTVESPDAVNLPVGLAVALLKDRRGEIHLDLPVSGRTDDPEFRVGKVIVQMLMNLLTKAATSPFSLLGAVLPGGEEFNALEFDYGSFQLTEHTAKKLEGITAALYERPALRLDIEGHVDLEHDREAWREYLFMKELKALKLKKLAKKAKADISLDEVTIEPHEYEKYLKKVYKAENFKKPKNALGLAKGLPVPEMEALIRNHIDVSDHDLRFLALQRAQKVKDYILQSGEVEPERIFLVEAKSLSPAKKEHIRNSRVDLKLR